MDNVAFDVSTDIDDLLIGLRSFVEAEVVTRHEEAGELLSDPRNMYGPDGLYTAPVLELIGEVRVAAAKAGYYSMFAPASIGGGGLGSVALYQVWHDLHHRFGPHYWLKGFAVAHWTKGPSHVLAHATPAAQALALPDLLAGRTSMCFGMSEPDAGTDARMMQTRAVRDGSGWSLAGSKIWITNAPYADWAVIFAVTDPELAAARRGGISAFLVPMDAPGLVVEGSIRMFGHLGGDEGQIFLDDVHVDDDLVLGEVGQGFAIAMSGVASGRLYNSARAVGLGRWALEMAVEYADRRHTFGRPISEHQGVSFQLADSAVELHAAHLVGLNCAILLDRGEKALKELSMAKLLSTEAGARTVDRVMQVHGAIGFTNELGLVETYEHLRKICVADGASEILRQNIAERLRRGDLAL